MLIITLNTHEYLFGVDFCLYICTRKQASEERAQE